ncbi:hypothetical protein [Flavobacterium sp. UMI-01]|uniref:hypothetical protein n=1 Tax=Flavobacterium sp. UMI-01 TaxID=1441053 RepID=UPI001C7DC1F5|nr:hypothetical protein [Flavobacterium sp. UMI-01]GIZ10578.1 hypothetical protein FUMI01_33020 [Flavobacterium sp. UMI-01]
MQKKYKPSPNSFKHTFCEFHEVALEEINGLDVQFQSKSGSTYYYTLEGMYRFSNHWGRLANCKWRLLPLTPPTENKFKLGFARWDYFYPDKEDEKLYFIEVDYPNNTVNYQHKNSVTYDGLAVLRTSFEVTKKIKQIRNLQQLTSWAKYFEYEDLENLRQSIIQELVYTEKTLDEIKAQFL